MLPPDAFLKSHELAIAYIRDRLLDGSMTQQQADDCMTMMKELTASALAKYKPEDLV
jgi:hypothetical protein